ncbi:hypothetical protein [Azotobacter chroococcum]|uniref:TubC N-terminal docking domain-containing protein n=1 Tax=Azotobacter chroococcum NCIMB 8003 TaxID=1328314 RepID=A0A0C4WRD7_9GAMM|nr:hypothetical protein [Azotobacter chroococcum]AJE23154.1 Hypothetical protein Achr_37660 [Azotobacter chroococcum NCIMB 8003]ASL28225.1 hypothetical protein ACG10_19335 [Azotobacter chroococcum]MEE4460947.1 hypothetical protein [Azotobacter chroococcum]TBW08445.1 hypothetical protein E0E52_09510 [Azotobacter chroococcum]
MNAFEIIRRAKDEGVTLTPKGNRLHLEAKHLPPPDLLAELKAHKALVIEILNAAKDHPRRNAWTVSMPGYRFTLIGPFMSRNQALAIARWRWGDADIVD